MAAPNIVNVTSIYGKTMGAALGTSANTDILGNGSSSQMVLKINSIIVANVDGSNAATVNVHFYDHDNTTRYNIAHVVSVPAASTLVVIGKDSPIYLEEGDQIEASASASGDLEMIISYEELSDS